MRDTKQQFQDILEDSLRRQLQEDHVYGEVLEQQKRDSVEQMKEEIENLDHDCGTQLGDGCSACVWLLDATDDEIIEKWKELREEGIL